MLRRDDLIDLIGQAMRMGFVSETRVDDNAEPANLVDGLFYIGDQLNRIADKLAALTSLDGM